MAHGTHSLSGCSVSRYIRDPRYGKALPDSKLAALQEGIVIVVKKHPPFMSRLVREQLGIFPPSSAHETLLLF